MKKSILLAITLAFSGIILPALSSQSVPFVRPEVGERVKAYEGPEETVVWTLRYGKPENHKALVQITNIDHPWNKQIFLMNVEDSGAKKYYYMNVERKRFNVLFFTQHGLGNLSLPSRSNILPVFYSRDYSAEGNAQAFLTDYLNRTNSD